MAAKIKADSYRFKTESEVFLAPERKKLYSHLFNSDSVAAGAIGLDVSLGKARMPDGKIILKVEVKNKGAGHKMPSGSSDLRVLWLDVLGNLLCIEFSPGKGSDHSGLSLEVPLWTCFLMQLHNYS